MFDGKILRAATGTPIRRIARANKPFADADPEPLTFANLTTKSLTRAIGFMSVPKGRPEELTRPLRGVARGIRGALLRARGTGRLWAAGPPRALRAWGLFHAPYSAASPANSTGTALACFPWQRSSACAGSNRNFCMSHAPVGQRSAHSPQCRQTSSSFTITRPVLTGADT